MLDIPFCREMADVAILELHVSEENQTLMRGYAVQIALQLWQR